MLAGKAWNDPVKSDAMLNRNPIGRFVELGEVSSIIASLPSDEAAMGNGIHLLVDSGFPIRSADCGGEMQEVT